MADSAAADMTNQGLGRGQQLFSNCFCHRTLCASNHLILNFQTFCLYSVRIEVRTRTDVRVYTSRFFSSYEFSLQKHTHIYKMLVQRAQRVLRNVPWQRTVSMLVKAVRVLTVGVWAATSRFLSRLSRNTLVNLVMLLFMMWLVTFYEMVKYRAVRVVRLSPSLSSSSATPSSPSSFSLYTAVAAATVSLPCLKMEHLFHTRHLTLRYTHHQYLAQRRSTKRLASLKDCLLI